MIVLTFHFQVEDSRKLEVNEKIKSGSVFTLDDAIDAGLVDGSYLLMETKIQELLMVERIRFKEFGSKNLCILC